jgi:hypothetical protein
MLTRREPRAASLLAVVVMLAGVTFAFSAAPRTVAVAQSDQECWQQQWVIIGEDEQGNPTYGWRLVNTCEEEGDPGGGGPSACEHPDLGEVPCYDPAMGWYSESYDCYLTLASPQPPAGDPAWGDNSPEDGAIYMMSCAEGGDTWDTGPVFLDEAPELPSVSQLAQQAMESLPLVGADIGIAPSPEGTGLVGLNVWMWTNDSDATWGPVSVSVPGPGITVTAQGEATQIEWDMGDGNVVVCDGPGTPYHPRYGGERSPDCPHVYTEPSRDQPNGRYTVTAATTWHVEWWVEPRGSAAEGEDLFFRTSEPVQVRINELQVVTS